MENEEILGLDFFYPYFGISSQEISVKMDSITFGELIKNQRTKKQLPLREIASAIELDQSLLSKIERDKIIDRILKFVKDIDCEHFIKNEMA